jgi:hypothetical protein
MKTGAAGRYEPCGARFSGIIGVSDAGMDEFGADPVHGGGTRAASGSTDERTAAGHCRSTPAAFSRIVFSGARSQNRSSTTVSDSGLRSTGVGRDAGAVAHEQDIHRFDMLRQVEFRAYGFGFEHADPQRVEPQRRGAKHHVVGDDRSVDVADHLAVVFPLPGLAGIGAYDDGAGRPEIARAACQACHAFFGTHDDEPLRLAVGARGSHAAGFEDRVEFCLFDLLGRIFTAGIPFLG